MEISLSGSVSYPTAMQLTISSAWFLSMPINNIASLSGTDSMPGTLWYARVGVHSHTHTHARAQIRRSQLANSLKFHFGKGTALRTSLNPIPLSVRLLLSSSMDLVDVFFSCQICFATQSQYLCLRPTWRSAYLGQGSWQQWLSSATFCCFCRSLTPSRPAVLCSDPQRRPWLLLSKANLHDSSIRSLVLSWAMITSCPFLSLCRTSHAGQVWF